MKHFLAIMLLTVACTKSEPVSGPSVPPASQPVAEKPAPSDEEATAPLRVLVDGPQAVTDGSDIEIAIKIVRSRASSAPVSLSIAVPASASVLSGKTTETIVDATSPTIERRLRLHVTTVPADDVVVTADIDTSDLGAHASKAYRFGRPEPKLPQPAKTGPSLKVNGHGMGAPVKAD